MSEIQMEDRQPPVMTADNADHGTTYIGFECIPEAWSTWPDNEEHILPPLQTVQATIQPAPSRHGVMQLDVPFLLLLLITRTNHLLVIRTSTAPHYRSEDSVDEKFSHRQNRQPKPRLEDKTSQVDCDRLSEPFCIERQ